MKHFTSFCCILIFLLGACVSADKSGEVEADVVLHLDADSLQTDDWAERMLIEEIVYLNDNEDSLFSVAQKCLLSDTRMVFWDYKMKCVYVYDREGHFLFTIGRQGGAGYECAHLRDIYVGQGENSRIELLDATGILVFDAADGHFIEKRKLGQEHLAEYFLFTPLSDDDYLLFASDGEYTVYHYSDGLMKGLRKRKGYQLVSDRFTLNGKTCLVNADYGMFTIDTYRNGALEAAYYLDFGDEALPASLLPQNSRQFDQVDEKKEYFKAITSVFESDKLLYAQVVGPAQTYYDVCYYKESKHLLAGPSDLDLGMGIIAVEGESFYALVYPEYISEDSALYKHVKPYFVRGTDSNPILVKYRLERGLSGLALQKVALGIDFGVKYRYFRNKSR